jgi:hypothetical protein
MFRTKTFCKNEKIEIRPLDDYSSAFVFQVSPPSILLIDIYSWLIIELCEGQSFEKLKESYLLALASFTLNSEVDTTEVDTRLVEILEVLEQRGLIVSNKSN